MKRHRIATQAGSTCLFLLACMAGCERGHPALNGPGDPKATPLTVASGSSAAPADPHMHQSFVEATRQEPPADWQRPPDMTMTGKSVGKLYTEVVNAWDTIRFTSAAGKPIAYRATLDTELGSVVIDLRPDLAPNHVRNFVALALVHYYDGLVFDFTLGR